MRHLRVAALCSAAGLSAANFVVDRDTSTFHDAQGRQRYWHGMNLVEKGFPYYPAVQQSDLDMLKAMGHEAIRLGVMMPGMYPNGPTLNVTYLDQIERLVKLFYDNGFLTIIDLHQDVLAPKICGEGTPDWMLDVDSLHAMKLPQPAALHAVDIDPTTGHPKSCNPVGPLTFIGWSMWYMTDQCGKAFEQLYNDEGLMAAAFRQYWSDVAQRFKGNPGILAYELMNEPWIGDFVHDPLLLLEAGQAEKKGVGKYMQRMHDVVRAIDNDTLIMYAPAEVNNRAMRRVGYEEGFLPGAAMAHHVYCVTGTDGYGPTNPITKEICHLNDRFTLKQRESDLRRLRTAGFVTEFGAVNPSDTGFAEVNFILDHFDSMQPPSSWTFWEIGELTRQNASAKAAYMKVLARPYARAVAGELTLVNFNRTTDAFELHYSGGAEGGMTEVVLGKPVNYPGGFEFSVSPDGVATAEETDFGIRLTTTEAGAGKAIALSVTAKTEVSIQI